MAVTIKKKSSPVKKQSNYETTLAAHVDEFAEADMYYQERKAEFDAVKKVRDIAQKQLVATYEIEYSGAAGDNIVSGNKHRVRIGKEVQTTEVTDMMKCRTLLDKVAKGLFLKSVKVSITALREHLTKAEIETITSTFGTGRRNCKIVK